MQKSRANKTNQRRIDRHHHPNIRRKNKNNNPTTIKNIHPKENGLLLYRGLVKEERQQIDPSYYNIRTNNVNNNNSSSKKTKTTITSSGRLPSSNERERLRVLEILSLLPRQKECLEDDANDDHGEDDMDRFCRDSKQMQRENVKPKLSSVSNHKTFLREARTKHFVADPLHKDQECTIICDEDNNDANGSGDVLVSRRSKNNSNLLPISEYSKSIRINKKMNKNTTRKKKKSLKAASAAVARMKQGQLKKDCPYSSNNSKKNITGNLRPKRNGNGISNTHMLNPKSSSSSSDQKLVRHRKREKDYMWHPIHHIPGDRQNKNSLCSDSLRLGGKTPVVRNVMKYYHQQYHKTNKK